VTNPIAKKKENVKHPFPTPISVKDALEQFVDLRGTLKKKTLRDLSDYCKDEDEKKKLLSLSESKDADGKFVQ